MTLAVLAGVFVVLLFLRVPVAFCIGLSSLAAMLCSMPADPAAMTIAQRVGMSVTSFPLLAIPFFVLAGKLLATGGVARRLLDFARVSVGFLPGGIALTTVMGNMLFGAVSGSAAAAASGIGSFMIPAMEKEGYPREYATALTVTAATTGLLIPPSNVFIVYAMVAGGVSIGALFVAGYLPGILMGLALIVVAVTLAGRQGLGARQPRPTLAELGGRLVPGPAHHRPPRPGDGRDRERALHRHRGLGGGGLLRPGPRPRLPRDGLARHPEGPPRDRGHHRHGVPAHRDLDGHGLDLRLRRRPPAHRPVHPRGEREPLRDPAPDQPHPARWSAPSWT